ncbi:MAG: sulfotransferase family protein [Bacteroidota bacterium]
MQSTNKIFGIGLSKTATTSLACALRQLDIPTKDFPSLAYTPHRLKGIREVQLQDYQAFTDIPTIPFYKAYDQRFPNSKFIYTIRERTSWLASCEKYPRFSKPIWRLPLKVIKLRQVIYRSIKFNEMKFSDAYDRHHEAVMTYFQDRPEDLLILNICGGDEWAQLCPFLGKEIPDVPFPFANVRRNGYV